MVTILNYFINSPRPPSPAEVDRKEAEDVLSLFLFIAKRCSLKLQSRIANGERLWSAHPTHIIRDWYRSKSDHGLVSQTIMLPAVLKDVLENEYGFVPFRRTHQSSDSLLPYVVGPDNALRWAEMLVTCQEAMDGLFKSLLNGYDLQLATKGYLSAMILDTVFQRGLLEILITDALAWNMRMKYKRVAGESRLPLLNSNVVCCDVPFPGC